jgi:Legume lectin domain
MSLIKASGIPKQNGIFYRNAHPIYYRINVPVNRLFIFKMRLTHMIRPTNAKHLLLNQFLLIILVGVIFSVRIDAQINYTDFPASVSGDFSFLGGSGMSGNTLRLTPNTGGGRSAIWHKTEQRVTDGFVCMFNFRIVNGSGSTGGADGFAFVIQNYSTDAPYALGGAGGNMGYARDPPISDGIPYSLAIEFDKYNNFSLNDPDNNHISVHTAGQYFNDASENASLGRTSSIPDLRDGAIHTVRIEYDGATAPTPNIMRIYLDDLTAPILTVTADLNTILYGGLTDAWVGFTAGSALEWEDHEISNWSFSSNFTTQQYAGTASDADATGSNTVTSQDYHPGADANGFNTTAKVDTSIIPDRNTELWAKYYFPNNLSGSSYPLVVLLHGNHGTCGTGSNPRSDSDSYYTRYGTCDPGYIVTPNHNGYDYLAQKLASWGYIVASVNANMGLTGAAYDRIRCAANPAACPLAFPYTAADNPKFPEYQNDSSLILARGRLLLRHLQKLSEWNNGVAPFATVNSLGT